MEMTELVIGAKWDGLVGLSLALTGVKWLTGAVMTPTVVRAGLGRGRHRHSDLAPEASQSELMAHAMSVTSWQSQQAALALLLLLSSPE